MFQLFTHTAISFFHNFIVLCGCPIVVPPKQSTDKNAFPMMLGIFAHTLHRWGWSRIQGWCWCWCRNWSRLRLRLFLFGFFWFVLLFVAGLQLAIFVVVFAVPLHVATPSTALGDTFALSLLQWWKIGRLAVFVVATTIALHTIPTTRFPRREKKCTPLFRRVLCCFAFAWHCVVQEFFGISCGDGAADVRAR